MAGALLLSPRRRRADPALSDEILESAARPAQPHPATR